MSFRGSLCRLLLVVSYASSLRVYSRQPRNVLMLIADDMRPEIGAFYDPIRPYSMYSRILTPSLNALAARSLVLRRAYVQQAICAPSRLSFLTSRRPDTTLIYTIEDTYWRNVAGNLTTIPQFFKQNGYRSIGIGKVFHHGPGSDHVSICFFQSRSFKKVSNIYVYSAAARLSNLLTSHAALISYSRLYTFEMEFICRQSSRDERNKQYMHSAEQRNSLCWPIILRLELDQL